mmetsp:Transcript_15642/g.23690  ORF Transcript_15642/g.23690 Transcript_15642/m.23690 type:complete len:106 (+) Transcript_15642:96-413(+)
MWPCGPTQKKYQVHFCGKNDFAFPERCGDNLEIQYLFFGMKILCLQYNNVLKLCIFPFIAMYTPIAAPKFCPLFMILKNVDCSYKAPHCSFLRLFESGAWKFSRL